MKTLMRCPSCASEEWITRFEVINCKVCNQVMVAIGGILDKDFNILK